jgi:hypothetical protein
LLAPPAPTTTGYPVLPDTETEQTSTKPPAPPAPPWLTPPEPPPPITKTLASLVPGCVVSVDDPVDVVDVTLFLPRDVTFVGPIIPPLPAII